MESINYLEQQTSINFSIKLIDEKFLNIERSKPTRILDIGCGRGFFLALLKNHYKEKIDAVGVEPSKQEIGEATANYPDITFYATGIIDFYQNHKDEKFDLVIFSKSLHHCDDLENSIKSAYELVTDNGILLAEEMHFDNLDSFSANWFIERLDLIKATGLFTCPKFIPIGNADPSTYIGHPNLFNLLDENLEPEKRFDTCRNEPYIHQPKYVDNTLISIFGADKVKFIRDIPFLFYVLSSYKLEDTENGKAVLSEFRKQEERAIANGTIKAGGYNIIIEKN